MAKFKRVFKHNIIGSATAGTIGMPGSSYEKIDIEIAMYDDNVFEVMGRYERGSNHGYLEPHHSMTSRDRGKDLNGIIANVSQDILEWDCNIPIPERRSAIRDAVLDAQDWMEEELDPGAQIERLEAVIDEIRGRKAA